MTPLLLASVVDVTIIMTLALLASAALRRSSAAMRHTVLAAAIIAAVLAPALEHFLPRLPVLHWGDAAPAVSSGAIVSAVAVPAASVTAAFPQSPPAIPWAMLLVAVWSLGALVTLGGLLIGLMRLARVTAGGSPVREGRWRELADALSQAHAMRQRVVILQSDDPAILITCGLWRPTIVLPAGADQWTDERRRIVLDHELAHIRRHDGAMQLGGELVRVMHWFNPLVWMACRRLRQESECACDDVVLSSGIEAAEYATHLLDVATLVAHRHQAWASAPAIAHPSTLERRIAAMLNPQRNRRLLTRRAWASVVLASIAVIVPLAAASIAPADSPAPLAATTRDVTLAVLPPALVDTPVPAAQPGSKASRPRAKVPAAAAAPPVTAAARESSPAVAPALMPPAPTGAAAQSAPGTMTGVVLDQSGAVLPGATVVLTDTELNTSRTIASDTSGRFTFRNLQSASYVIAVSLPGFATVTALAPVAPGGNITRVLMLPVGTLEEAIMVTCAGSPLAAGPVSTGPGARRTADRRVGERESIRNGWTRLIQTILPVLSAQQAFAPAPVRVGGNVRPPRKLMDVRPQCPASLPAASATVSLVGRIDPDGVMKELRPISLESPGELIQSALDAVRQWRYSPTLLNGQPVNVSIVIQVGYGVR